MGGNTREDWNMKKRILSLVCSVAMLCTLIMGNARLAHAEDDLICVDGSYLTMEESSTGTTSNGLARGEHLMDGESAISITGIGKVYAYGDTTAFHTVDYVSVTVYVERYSWETGQWHQVDAWTVDKRNHYYVSSGRTVTVEGGFYYRVRCVHSAGNDANLPYDSAVSRTDGVWVRAASGN